MNHRMILTTLTLTLTASLLTAGAALASETKNTPAPGGWRVGTELDVLPYTTGGYYGSIIVGRNVWRFRGVAAAMTVPAFAIPDGFDDKQTEAYAPLVDRFFGRGKERLAGLWVGGGVELWRNRISLDGSPEDTHYDNVVLTAGGGYTWYLTRHIYLNPWAAAHLVVAGDRQIDVSGTPYNQPRLTPEASIKLGFIF